MTFTRDPHGNDSVAILGASLLLTGDEVVVLVPITGIAEVEET